MTDWVDGHSQPMQALRLANTIRIGGVVVRQELRCGVITLQDALGDERSGVLPITRLLCAMPGWGPVRSDSMLLRMFISPGRRVRDLTDRQKGLIVDAVNNR